MHPSSPSWIEVPPVMLLSSPVMSHVGRCSQTMCTCVANSAVFLSHNKTTAGGPSSSNRSVPAGLDRLVTGGIRAAGWPPDSSAAKGETKSNTFSRHTSRQRPRTATAAGRTRTEASLDRGLRDGLGSAGAGNRKRRPRSASSICASPGRSRPVRETTGQARNGGYPKAGGGGCGGGDDAGFGWEEADEKEGLPHGWSEAIDEETGHVYYYSDKR